MEKMEPQELISALADGQLQGAACARAVQVAAGDSQSLAAWQAYHLIGDVLRSGELALGRSTSPAAFLARLQLRLQKEAVPCKAPVAISSVAQEVQPARAAGQSSSKTEAANDASFRWKLVAGFASLAAVAAIGWTAVGGQGKPAEQAQLASAAQPVMIRDPRLDELLAAHRQLGGTAALQMPAGFLRNTTFEGPAR